MFNQSSFRSSKSRPTKHDGIHEQLDEQITAYFSTLDTPINAEDAWFNLKMNGVEMSMTAFYNRLRKLVETGIIEKLSHGYNKNEYFIKH